MTTGGGAGGARAGEGDGDGADVDAILPLRSCWCSCLLSAADSELSVLASKARHCGNAECAESNAETTPMASANAARSCNCTAIANADESEAERGAEARGSGDGDGVIGDANDGNSSGERGGDVTDSGLALSRAAAVLVVVAGDAGEAEGEGSDSERAMVCRIDADAGVCLSTSNVNAWALCIPNSTNE